MSNDPMTQCCGHFHFERKKMMGVQMMQDLYPSIGGHHKLESILTNVMLPCNVQMWECMMRSQHITYGSGVFIIKAKIMNVYILQCKYVVIIMWNNSARIKFISTTMYIQFHYIIPMVPFQVLVHGPWGFLSSIVWIISIGYYVVHRLLIMGFQGLVFYNGLEFQGLYSIVDILNHVYQVV